MKARRQFEHDLRTLKSTDLRKYCQMLNVESSKHNPCIDAWNVQPTSGILLPNLNNNWMTAVIGRSRYVTSRTTFRLVRGRILDLDQMFDHFKTLNEASTSDRIDNNLYDNIFNVEENSERDSPFTEDKIRNVIKSIKM